MGKQLGVYFVGGLFALVIAACGGAAGNADLFDAVRTGNPTAGKLPGTWNAEGNDGTVKVQLRMQFAADSLKLAKRCTLQDGTLLAAGISVAIESTPQVIRVKEDKKDEQKKNDYACSLELKKADYPYQLQGLKVTIGPNGDSVSLTKISD